MEEISERDAYMNFVTESFSDELLALYEQDGSVNAVHQLTASLENGVTVWHYPVQLPSPA